MEFVKYGVGWIIAIVFGAAGIYYFLYNRRRKKVELNASWSSITVTLMRDNDALKVLFDDVEVGDPFIYALAVTNIGHKDISSKDFDADKPWRVNVGAKVVARLEISDEQPDKAFEIDPDDDRFIQLKPVKIAVGETLRIRVLVDGEPDSDYGDNPLIDTDMVRGFLERARVLKARERFRKITISLSAVGLLSCLLILALPDKSVQKQSPSSIMTFVGPGAPWLGILFYVLIFCGVATAGSMAYAAYKGSQLDKMRARIAHL